MKCHCPAPPIRITNTRVTLLRFDGTENADDEKLRNDPTAYDALGDRWAAWKTRAGSERFASDQMQAGHSHRLYLRWDAVTSTLTPLDRVKRGTRTFNIDAVSDEDEQRKWMVLDVTETK